eukprot:scaffold2562_cov354-Prasinococcus_capsulatus_cf.AAC.6
MLGELTLSAAPWIRRPPSRTRAALAKVFGSVCAAAGEGRAAATRGPPVRQERRRRRREVPG